MSNVASSILLNPELLESVYESSQNSEGSAQQELDKYLEGISGHVNQLKNSVQELFKALMQDDTVIWAIDRLKDIVEGLTKLTEKLGGVPIATFALGVGFMSQKLDDLTKVFAKVFGVINGTDEGVKKFKDTLASLNQTGSKYKSIGDALIGDSSTKAVEANTTATLKNAEAKRLAAIREHEVSIARLENENAALLETQASGVVIMNDDYEALASRNVAIAKHKEAISVLEASAADSEEAATSIANATANEEQAMSAGNVGKGLLSSAKSSPVVQLLGKGIGAIGGGSVAAGAAVLAAIVGPLLLGAIATAVAKAKQDKAYKEAVDLGAAGTQKIDEAKSHIQEYENSVKELSSSYTTLRKKINSANTADVDLTTEEYEEWLDINKQIIDLNPQMKVTFDEQGNMIADLGGTVDEVTDSLNEMYEAEKRAAYNSIQEGLKDETFGKYAENNKKIADELSPESAKEGSIQERLLAHSNDTYLSETGESFFAPRIAVAKKDLKTLREINERINQEFDLQLEIARDAQGNYADLDGDFFIDTSDLSPEQIQEIYDWVGDNLDVFGDAYAIKYKEEMDKIANEEYYGKLPTVVDILEKNGSFDDLGQQGKDLAYAMMQGLDYNEVVGTKTVAGDTWFDQMFGDTFLGDVYGTKKKVDQTVRDVINDEYGGDITQYIMDNLLGWTADANQAQQVSELYAEIMSPDPDATAAEVLKRRDELMQKLSEIMGIDSDQLYKMLNLPQANSIDAVKARFTGTSEHIGSAKTPEEAEKKKMQDYIDSLNSEEIDILLGIDDPSKFKTTAELKEYIDEQTKSAKINVDLEYNPTKGLTDLKNAFSGFESIYDNIHSNTTVAADSVESLVKSFGDLKNEDGTAIQGADEAIQKFRNTITTMPNDVKAQQDALNELATFYLDQSDLIQNLTEDNKDYTASELKKLGVENAEEVVLNRLAIRTYTLEEAQDNLNTIIGKTTDSKIKAKLATIDLANMTSSEYSVIMQEAQALGIDTTALRNYYLSKVDINRMIIDTSGDIAALNNLLKELGIVNSALLDMQNLVKKIGKPTGEALNAYNKQNEANVLASWASKLNTDFKKTNISYSGVTASGGGGGGGGGGSSSHDSDTEKTKELFDWIEVALKRIQEAYARLEKVSSNVYKLWQERNTALNQQLGKTREEIELQKKAYQGYMDYANSIGLSAEYVQKVQNGKIQIEEIADDDLREKISGYQQWYEKAIACKDAIQDLNIQLGDLYKQKFDNIKSEFDSFISNITSQADLVNERISRTEEKGYFVSKNYYNQLINFEKAELNELTDEYNRLINAKNEALNSGSIQKNSEAWFEMENEILSVEKAIEESTTALVEYSNTMRDIDWSIFDYIRDRIAQITQEAEFLTDLLDNDEMFKENGLMNERGMASTGLHALSYNTYMDQANEYAKEMKKIYRQLANDPNNKTLIERREELLKLQQESIKSAEAEKEAIRELVRQGIEKHLEYLTKLIDKYKEGLNSAKDLFEYQKNIADQTKNIGNLTKILEAYKNDDSEETRKILQETRNQLQEAKDELKETEWDRYISETETLLDDLYEEYSEVLNARLDDLDALVADMIQVVNDNASSIQTTLTDTATKVGYELTSSMNTIFKDGKSAVTTFNKDFNTYSTNTMAALNAIKNSIKAMEVAAASKTTQSSTATISNSQSSSSASSSAAHSTPTAPSSPAPAAPASPQGNGQPNVGDRVRFNSGRYYENSYGGGRSGSQMLGQEVYITKINPSGSKPYHLSRGNTLGNRDLGWVTLDQISGYATGGKNIKDLLAWTQEEGGEIIRRSDGAILTPIGNGGMVFDNEASKKLWDIAHDNYNTHSMVLPFNKPDASGNGSGVTVDMNIGQVVANDPVEFTDKLRQAVADNTKVQKAIQSITIDRVAGYGKLNSKKYR